VSDSHLLGAGAPSARSPRSARAPSLGQEFRRAVRSADSYGLVLVLLAAGYVAMSALSAVAWGRTLVVAIQALTLLLVLYTSRVPAALMRAALAAVGVSVILSIAGELLPGFHETRALDQLLGTILLLTAMLVILRRIASHTVVTRETILGAIDVYVLAGSCFAMIYSIIAALSLGPFFSGVPRPAVSEFLFFSFTTITTTGYGNLVPASPFGQSLAVVEAIFGQIYLVIIVARLVSLWGQARPGTRQPDAPTPGDGPRAG
jgi:Ion channel